MSRIVKEVYGRAQLRVQGLLESDTLEWPHFPSRTEVHCPLPKSKGLRIQSQTENVVYLKARGSCEPDATHPNKGRCQGSICLVLHERWYFYWKLSPYCPAFADLQACALAVNLGIPLQQSGFKMKAGAAKEAEGQKGQEVIQEGAASRSACFLGFARRNKLSALMASQQCWASVVRVVKTHMFVEHHTSWTT